MRSIVVLFGGKTPEHDVSRRSAKYIFKNLNRKKYKIRAVGITKSGYWVEQSLKEIDQAIEKDVPIEIQISEQDQFRINKHPSVSGFLKSVPNLLQKWVEIDQLWQEETPIIYSIIHGGQNELGMLPGFFESAEIPYIGCDHLGSGIAMDKILAKQIADSIGIPTVPYVSIDKYNFSQEEANYIQQVNDNLTYPVFVKPNNGGSSVGVYKVDSPDMLGEALQKALRYDARLLVETGINCREIECAVLGGDKMHVSVPGEVIANANFYDYESKYGDTSESVSEIPAKLSDTQTNQIRDYTGKIFKALRLHGLSRIDYLLERSTGNIYFNEVNTNPGFTSISQYPLLLEHDGIEGSELLDRFLAAAIEKWQIQQDKLL